MESKHSNIEVDHYDKDFEGEDDVFGSEKDHAIKYKTLSWPMVAFLMITEIVSNGTTSLPSSLAVVGMVPGVILTFFLGVFATYTAWLLIRFKLNHPEVHTMGDAGYILMGPLGRELLAFGTVAFALFGTGSQLVAGRYALAVLSDGKLCVLLYTGIFSVATLVCSFPRTFDRLAWLAIPATFLIIVSCVVAMVGAGLHPAPNVHIAITLSNGFFDSFSAVLNPVFAYAGHFMFFVLISEMKEPDKAMRSAYMLQGTATTFYTVFAAVTYAFLGPGVLSPSFLSLHPKWSKAAFGIALPNFLIAGSLYCHTAAKLVFVRIFRHSRHLHEHTVIGWGSWTALILIMNGAAFVLSVGVPIFNYLVGLAAALFAAWYTYGLAGAFWLYDAWHGMPYTRSNKYDMQNDGTSKLAAWKRHMFHTILSFLTLLAGLFICVGGLYVIIKAIIEAYDSGAIPQPFACYHL